ncbi:hypothetical protein [Streptomyces sp. bgisy060]|uniref:hypothetical protein n=1 Tax=Streptomyces sp. bgisy060 TaxID=3413775 RepID=UPI003EBB0A97
MTTSLPELALARHYFETRREVLAAAGHRTKPWFRLTADERSVAVAEASLIREALRRAEAEQRMIREVAQAVKAPRRVRLLPLV